MLVSRGASSGGEEKKEEGVSKTTYMSVLPDLQIPFKYDDEINFQGETLYILLKLGHYHTLYSRVFVEMAQLVSAEFPPFQD